MFPSGFTEASAVLEEKEDSGVDFLFDYGTGQHIMHGSVLRECTDLEKVRQYIQNVLRTQANVYGVYTDGETDIFGLSVYNYIGQRSIHMGYVNSELKREVTELLLKHPLIADITDWQAKREKQGLNIAFTAVLANGDLIKTTETISGGAVM